MKFNLSLPLCALALIIGVGGCDKTVSGDTVTSADGETSLLENGESCAMLSGNAKDICDKEAEGRKWVEAAEMTATSQPSDQHTYDLKIARADAIIAVARERCDDLSGNPEDVCQQEAERAYEVAKADATLQLKLSDASAAAAETTTEANQEAAETKDAARAEAADIKQDAALDVAKEQCDRFAHSERQDCIRSAEATYAKN